MNRRAAAKATGARVVRRYCGNDGGLLSAKSSPSLFWLARQIAGETQC